MLNINAQFAQSFTTRLNTSVNLKTIQDTNLKQNVDASKLAGTTVKPVTQDSEQDSIARLFEKFDLDNNGRITKEEAIEVFKEDGKVTAERARQLIDTYLGNTSDLNGDGLSLQELRRTIAIQAGDAFAIGDLNGDDKVTLGELERTIEIYTANGGIDEKAARKIFNAGDTDKDGVLTRAEFDSFLDRIANITDVKPVPAPPSDDARATLKKVFDDFDLDKNGLVTEEEIYETVKRIGGTEDDARKLVETYLNPTTDLDGNGVSFTELVRHIKISQGDTFAAGDLNSDGKITERELEKAIALYKENGDKFDENEVREFFKNADANKDGILTKAEFNNYKPDVVPTDPLARAKEIFDKFDANDDGEVTQEEVYALVKANGGTEDEARKLIHIYFGATTDVNGNGAISWAEAARHIKISQGDAFALGDLNNDGQITTRELNEAIALYQKTGHKFDESEVRKFFAGADANSDGILTKREYNAYDHGRPWIVPPQKPTEPVEPQKPIDVNALFERLFNKFDADNNGLVTKEELVRGLKDEGVDDDRIRSIVDNVLGPDTDLNGDGLSLAELRRRLAVDRGDVFAGYDLNGDNQITQRELEAAIEIYSRLNPDYNADRVRRIFAELDYNGDNVLTRREFVDRENKPDTFANFDVDGNNRVTREELEAVIERYQNAYPDFNADRVRRIFELADANNNDEVTRAELAALQELLYNNDENVADAAPADLVAQVKPQIARSIATFDTQLLLQLQDKA